MAVKPVAESDYYGKGFSQMEHKRQMVGPPVMNFKAMKSDGERIKTAQANNSYIDSAPAEPEWRAWQMRPREK